MGCPVSRDVGEAARVIRAGGLVGIPTETVYGLGANALDERAVARVFEAKNRPHFDPLIVHIPSVEHLDRYTHSRPAVVAKLGEAFWPGPLTLVLPKRAVISDLVTSGLETVAIRVPDHPLTLELLREADLPVAAPSANPFGCLSPTTAEHVADQLGERIDFILDGGPCRVGVESTVLLVTEGSDGTVARLLRPGGVSVEELEDVLGAGILQSGFSGDEQSAREKADQPQTAPGMLTRHYAPTTPLEIVDSFPVPQPVECFGALTFGHSDLPAGYVAVENLSESADLVEAAAGFFAALRRLDAQDLDRIFARPFPENGLGRALNDRLRRGSQTEE
ncbi:MAG: L-threonylcarbamoyladenylate synthase [Planctomycetaceae bacterium]